MALSRNLIQIYDTLFFASFRILLLYLIKRIFDIFFFYLVKNNIMNNGKNEKILNDRIESRLNLENSSKFKNVKKITWKKIHGNEISYVLIHAIS